jgi:hypothetical protein
MFAIQDTFNRADQGPPPSSGWTTPTGVAGCVVKDLQLAPDPTEGGNGRCVWNTQLGPDCGAEVTIPTRPDTNSNHTISLYVRAVDQSGNPSGYSVRAFRNPQTGDHYIYLYEGNASLGFFNVDWQSGDAIGVRAIGSDIEALYKPAAGSWATVISASGYDYWEAGYSFIYIDTADVGTRLDDFGFQVVSGISAPTGIEAHTVGETVVLTWENVPPDYTYLTVERAEAKAGPWEDLGVVLDPEDETATDTDPGSGGLWYHVYVENDHGDATTPDVRSTEFVRQSWNDTAHAMGIPDLPAPVAPFLLGEAGEQLFLVCCRLWRLAVAPDLPDPVLSEPADWREFIETGTFPS